MRHRMRAFTVWRPKFFRRTSVLLAASVTAVAALVAVPIQAHATPGQIGSDARPREVTEWDINNPSSYTSMIDQLRIAVSDGVLRQGVRNQMSAVDYVLVRVSDRGNSVVRFMIRTNDLYILGFDTGPRTRAYYFRDTPTPAPSLVEARFGVGAELRARLPVAGGYPALPALREQTVTRASVRTWLNTLRNYGGGGVGPIVGGALVMFIQMISEGARFHPISAGVRAGLQNDNSRWLFDIRWSTMENNWGRLSAGLRQALTSGFVRLLIIAGITFASLEDYGRNLAVARR